jgi:hypothetical protein
MFAYVKSGSIVSYPQENRGIEIDGIKHSADIYTKWTESERNAIGIYTIETLAKHLMALTLTLLKIMV